MLSSLNVFVVSAEQCSHVGSKATELGDVFSPIRDSKFFLSIFILIIIIS